MSIYCNERRVYLFHDVRFPLVTNALISDVLEEAKEHKVAMITGKVESDAYHATDGRIEVVKNPRYLLFPDAVKADYHALECLCDRRQMLQDLSYCESFLYDDKG